MRGGHILCILGALDAGFELAMLMECGRLSQGLSAQGIGVSLLFSVLFSVSKLTLLAVQPGHTKGKVSCQG